MNWKEIVAINKNPKLKSKMQNLGVKYRTLIVLSVRGSYQYVGSCHFQDDVSSILIDSVHKIPFRFEFEMHGSSTDARWIEMVILSSKCFAAPTQHIIVVLLEILLPATSTFVSVMHTLLLSYTKKNTKGLFHSKALHIRLNSRPNHFTCVHHRLVYIISFLNGFCNNVWFKT